MKRKTKSEGGKREEGGKRSGKAGVKEEREKKRGMSCNKWEEFILSTDFHWMKISVDDLTAKVPQSCHHILPLCQFYNQIQGYKTHVLDLYMQSSVTYIIFPLLLCIQMFSNLPQPSGSWVFMTGECCFNKWQYLISSAESSIIFEHSIPGPIQHGSH